MMPSKPRSEIYSALGLQKQGKNLFYRDFLYHLRHSSDKFRIAPGIKGMVMLVFDLPSFPFVFKVIKDFFPPQKETTREQIKGKYLLVKQHDRVGRMADTLEYSNVAFPRARFEDELVAELKRDCPSLIEEDGDDLVIRHLYIERRMIPLNIYLQEATREQIEHAVVEYGNAIKDLVAANIFPGDMLWKNFGVTRHGKVVFYDYDEIEYLTDCNFRRVPEARNEEEEMSGEVWYTVGPKDVFPETFGPFLLGNPTRARGLHEAPRRPARRGVLATPQGAHPRRPRARCVSLRSRASASSTSAGCGRWQKWRRRHERRRAAPKARAPPRGTARSAVGGANALRCCCAARIPRSRPMSVVSLWKYALEASLPPEIIVQPRSLSWPNPSSSSPPPARRSAACSATSVPSPRTSSARSRSRPRSSAPASPATPSTRC